MRSTQGVADSRPRLDQKEISGIGLLSGVTLIALQIWATSCDADGVLMPGENAEAGSVIEMGPIERWLKVRFSDAELQQLQAGELQVERHYCGCYDKPIKHYPYSIVLVRTPKGDLVTRPENSDVVVTFTPLAIRYGTKYCHTDSDQCYGSFPEVCDFTDFRYGPYLADFFPTCKTADRALSVDESKSHVE